jgi:hypothetical protein
MKRKTTVFIILLVTLVSLCMPVQSLLAGQASATASVIIIIPPREAATQTKIVQEEKTEQQEEADTQIAYAKN